jgi:hypothetical protein
MIDFSPLPWGEGGESSELGEGFLRTGLPPQSSINNRQYLVVPAAANGTAARVASRAGGNATTTCGNATPSTAGGGA